MFLLRLILLVTFVVHSISEPTTHCDSMGCFAPGPCFEPQKAATKLYDFSSSSVIIPSCEAIVKIRSYTEKHFLVILESNVNDVKSITLEQDANKFECQDEANGRITATFNGKPQDLLSKNKSPLSCEFYAKADPRIISSLGDAKLYTSKSPDKFFTITFDDFRDKIPKTCDPENALVRDRGEFSGDWIKPVDTRFNKLECPSPFKLMFREVGTNNYEDVKTIICNEKEYVVTLDSSSEKRFSEKFEVQCQATICTMCNISEALAVLDRVPGDCPTYKCPAGTKRIKVDNFEMSEGVVKCELDKSPNPEPKWRLGGNTINANAKIQCITKTPCNQTDADRLCEHERCHVDRNGIPKCIKPKQKLKLGDNDVTVVCNDDVGEYQILAGELRLKAFDNDNPIKCVDDSLRTPGASTSSFDPMTIAYAVGGLVAIGVVVGGIVLFLYCKKKKRREGGGAQVDLKTARENKESKSVESKSKESKSVNSSKKQAESKKEEDKDNKKVFIPLPMHQEEYQDWMTPEDHKMYDCRMQTEYIDHTTGGSTVVRKCEESVRRKDKRGKGNKKDKKKEDEEDEKEDPINEEPKKSDKKEDKKKKKDKKDEKGDKDEKKKEKSGSDRLQQTQASQADPPSATGFLAGDGQTTVIGGATAI